MPFSVIQPLLKQALMRVPGDLSELFSAIDRFLDRHFENPEDRLLLSVFTPAHPKGKGRAVQFPNLALGLIDLENLVVKQAVPYEPSIQENRRKQVQLIRANAPTYIGLIASADGTFNAKIKALLDYYEYIFKGVLGSMSDRRNKTTRSRVSRKTKESMCSAASLAVDFLNGLPATADVDDYYRTSALNYWTGFLASDVCQQGQS